MRREPDPVLELSHRFRGLDDLEQGPELEAALARRFVMDASWGHLASVLVERDIVDATDIKDFLGISAEELADPAIVISDNYDLEVGNPYSVVFSRVYSSIIDPEFDRIDNLWEVVKAELVQQEGWIGDTDEDAEATLNQTYAEFIDDQDLLNDQYDREEDADEKAILQQSITEIVQARRQLQYQIRAAQSEYKVPLLGFISVIVRLDREQNVFGGQALALIARWAGEEITYLDDFVEEDDIAGDVILDRAGVNTFFDMLRETSSRPAERQAEDRTQLILSQLKPRPLKELLGAMHHSNPRA